MRVIFNARTPQKRGYDVKSTFSQPIFFYHKTHVLKPEVKMSSQKKLYAHKIKEGDTWKTCSAHV